MTREYSDRELVLMKREAALTALDHVKWYGDDQLAYAFRRQTTDRLFPLPKRTVPRVVPDPDGSEKFFRVTSGALECKHPAGDWLLASSLSLGTTSARIRVWADLLASPTVEETEE